MCRTANAAARIQKNNITQLFFLVVWSTNIKREKNERLNKNSKTVGYASNEFKDRDKHPITRAKADITIVIADSIFMRNIFSAIFVANRQTNLE